MFVCLLTGAYDGDNVCEWEALSGSAVCGTWRVQQGRYSVIFYKDRIDKLYLKFN